MMTIETFATVCFWLAVAFYFMGMWWVALAFADEWNDLTWTGRLLLVLFCLFWFVSTPILMLGALYEWWEEHKP